MDLSCLTAMAPYLKMVPWQRFRIVSLKESVSNVMDLFYISSLMFSDGFLPQTTNKYYNHLLLPEKVP